MGGEVGGNVDHVLYLFGHPLAEFGGNRSGTGMADHKEPVVALVAQDGLDVGNAVVEAGVPSGAVGVFRESVGDRDVRESEERSGGLPKPIGHAGSGDKSKGCAFGHEGLLKWFAHQRKGTSRYFTRAR